MVKARDRAFVSALHEFDSKDNKTGIGITSEHVRDEFDFLGSMQVRMMVWFSGFIAEELDRAIETFFPAVSSSLISASGAGDTQFISRADKGWMNKITRIYKHL